MSTDQGYCVWHVKGEASCPRERAPGATLCVPHRVLADLLTNQWVRPTKQYDPAVAVARIEAEYQREVQNVRAVAWWRRAQPS
jgi:hypothetical protein